MHHMSELKISLLECLISLNQKFPSLNASSPLECLFKPEGRVWAAEGGPEASLSSSKFRLDLVYKLVRKRLWQV